MQSSAQPNWIDRLSPPVQNSLGDSIRTMLRLVVAGLLLGLVATGALGQNAPFPNKVVKIVVPSVAGGLMDISARLIGTKLSAYWNVPVVIENKPGAAMTIGTQQVAKGPADGYTLLVGLEGSIVGNPIITGAPYSVGDFAPLALIWETPLVLLVSSEIPATNFAELNDYAKKNPGKLNFAVSDVTVELYSEMLKRAAGWEYTNVWYKGNAERMRSIMAGETQFALVSASDAVTAAKSGRAHSVAITSLRRSPKLPDLPTLDELGLKGFTITAWGGMFASARTPPAILAKLSADVRRAISEPDVAEKLESAGAESGGGVTAGQFAKRIDADVARWSEVAERRGIKTHDR